METEGSPEEILAAYDLEIKQIKIEQQRLSEKLKELTAARDKAYDAYMQSKSEKLLQEDWANKNFKWKEKVYDLLKNKFKLDKFREKQLACINATLAGQDVVLLMPTGGGKSLCFQLPALVTNGITLVVSPLISLMEDQVMKLKSLNISAEMISSTSSKELIKKVHDCLSNGSSEIKLLYVTPERLAKSKRLMSCLQKCYLKHKLDRIAIDEVHCCSQWGHDFRPDYKFLGVFKSMFPKVPILGLTATATTRVLLDVQKMLDINGCLTLKASFNRPNLYYEVRLKPSSQNECVELIENLLTNKYKNKSGIIYANSIKESTDLVQELRKRGLKIGCYHAELEADVRSKVHKKWHSQEYQAVVATVAFGMGIDKSDVRFVIHYTLPKSVENLYQESGRAGRDYKPADCILLYRLADVFKISGMVFSNKTGLPNLYNVVDYCIDANRCRRNVIAKYFDEVWEACLCNNMCDHCKKPTEIKEINITNYCRDIFKLLNHAAAQDVRLTAAKLMDAWFQQKGDTKLRLKSINIPPISRELGENIVAYLLINEYLKEDLHFTAYSTISYIKRGPKAVLALENDYEIKMSICGKRVSTNTTNLTDKSISNKRKHSENGESSQKKKNQMATESIDLT